ncbi:MAG: hypothetical protein LBR21_09835, partial [Propionibacteriaceae bacterium]|nr:hypothetical protein [Propionibacteriaceae bacterium]
MAKRSLPKHGLRSYSDDPVDLPPDDETLVLRRAIDEPLYQPDEPASASDYVPTRAGGNRGIPASPERFMDESVDAELPDWDTLRSFATPLGGRFADVATPEPAAKHAADGPDKERGILRRHRGRRERDAGEQLKPAKPGRALTDDPGAVSASATVSAPDWDQVSAPTPTRMQSTESTPFTASAGYTQTPETTQRPATSQTHALAATPETDHTQSP